MGKWYTVMYGTNPEDAGTVTILACLLGRPPKLPLMYVEKTQIFKLGEHNVPTKLEHDDFTKKVKNKVTVLGAVFCCVKRLLKTCRRPPKLSKSCKMAMVGFSAWRVKYWR